jgi:hypothetical protein
MTKQIPFLEELRQELLDRGPDAPFVSHPDSPSPRPRRTLAIAMVSFVGTLLLGTVAWLVASMGSEPADGDPLDQFVWDLAISLPAPENSTEFLTALEEIPGVASVVEYFPDLTVLYPLPASDSPTSPVVVTTVSVPDELAPITTALVLVTIDDTADASDVANRVGSTFGVYHITFSSGIASSKADEFWDQMSTGAEELEDDPLFLQPPPGPEPLFDTSGLGEEIVLIPATPDDPPPDFVLERTAEGEERGRPLVDFDRPLVNIGTVAEMDATMVIYGTSDGGYCQAVLEGSGWGSSCGDFTNELFGVTGAGTSLGGGYAEVRIPIESAVVQFSTDDDAPFWQRPVAGHALFPFETGPIAMFRVTAFDQDGDVIGEWVTDY